MWAIAKLALGSLFLGGFGSVAYYSTALDIDIPEQVNNDSPLTAKISKDQKNKFTTTPQNINKITPEDVEMYERDSGCKIVFTDNFDKKKSYNVRGWFNEKMQKNSKNKEKWRDRIADGIVYQKIRCARGKILVLEFEGGAFRTKESYKFETS